MGTFGRNINVSLVCHRFTTKKFLQTFPDSEFMSGVAYPNSTHFRYFPFLGRVVKEEEINTRNYLEIHNSDVHMKIGQQCKEVWQKNNINNEFFSFSSFGKPATNVATYPIPPS